jgi:glycerol-3-phosphate O-acyltransferase/dihydroxyacetone phosphate acyltransferase
LTYFSAHKFRSRAVIEFGDAVTVEPGVLQGFKDGKNKRKAIGDLMLETEKALKAVTVSAPDFDTLQVSLQSSAFLTTSQTRRDIGSVY